MPTLFHDLTTTVNPAPGHALRFIAGEPRNVPDRFVDACLEAGCQKAATKERTSEVKNTAKAIREVLNVSDGSELDKDGRVTAKALTGPLGYKPSAKVVAEAYKLVDKGET